MTDFLTMTAKQVETLPQLMQTALAVRDTIMIVTDIMVLSFGLRILLTRRAAPSDAPNDATAARVMVTGHMCPFSTCAII